jgi:pimeloyl-ACP methyl ester carboxylesterase
MTSSNALGGASGSSARDALPPALAGARREFTSPAAGRLSYYVMGEGAPLLLVHSINAAGSGYEVKPIYDRLTGHRTVYAIDLPGFGFSDRSDRRYSPRLMTDAIEDMVREIRRIHGPSPIDALALSLSCEFLARAFGEEKDYFRTLALVSPTGFDGRRPNDGPEGSTRAMPWLRSIFDFPLWSRGFFNLLTSRPSIRYFLQKTWGSKDIDEGLFAYDYLTTHQPGARHAPYYFVSGYLFSGDIGRLYKAITIPVWMAHGVRGDFTDYSGKRLVENRPNWTIDVFQTGALPHFEVPDGFMAGYARFLAGAGGGRSGPT